MRFLLPQLACLLLLVSPCRTISAQDSPPPAQQADRPVFTSARDAVPTVVSRDAHTRVEEWVERIIAEDGTANDVTHTYTVLSPGLHYLDGADWKETNPEFVPVAGGWLSARGQHQCLVSEELFVAGAVTVISPEGAIWKSTPMSLALRDRASGQVLVLGESRATRGELVAPNTVLFKNAFEGALNADVRVVNFAGGIECDVIVRSRLPAAALLGANPDQCDLVVQTEVFEGGPTTLRERQRPTGGQAASPPAGVLPDSAPPPPATRPDAVLTLGALTMEDGKAFGTDSNLATEPGHSVPVFKRYYQDQATQRVFLEESTPLDSLEPLMDELPEASLPGLWEQRWRDTALEGGSRKSERGSKLLPAPALPRRANGRFEIATAAETRTTGTGTHNFELASASASPGVVMDWSYLNTGGAFTLTAGSTYSITGAVTLGGSGLVVTVEPGVVVKYAPGVSASLSIASGSTLKWLAEPYRPVILTARDDNTVGETVANSTGVVSGTYASQALVLNGSGMTNELVLANLHVRHANYGVDAVYFGQNGPLKIRHGQFVSCTYPFKFQLGYTLGETYHLQNVLVTGARAASSDDEKPHGGWAGTCFGW